MNTTEFGKVRPYNDEELPKVFEELTTDPAFQKVVAEAIPDVPFEMLAQKMRACETRLELQRTFCYGLLWKLAGERTDGISLGHTAILDKSKAHIHTSNRRGIVPDSDFLSALSVDQGMDTVEIAIGNNLLVYPWIRKSVRANKLSIVQRVLTIRQMLESSTRIPRYMYYTIGQKNQSIWIVQREGRAKDPNDRTQDSMLEMLVMGGEGDIVDHLMEVDIAPFVISYGYDPCDHLKAQEFQLKRDIEGYRKTTEDDLENMQIGLSGYKGKVHFQAGACLNGLLSTVNRSLPKPELFTRTSTWIDEHIHGNYRLYPGNYAAHDLLTGRDDFESYYTLADKQRFEAYMEKQPGKIEIPDKDIPFLREKLLLVYVNSLVNYLVTRQ